jgi:ABC-2 type transport system ATP-binding protein
VVDVQLAFLDKYLMHEDISTGPGFEYQDQTGVWQSAASYPPQPSGSASASGGGYLWLNPLDTSGSLGIEATPAFNAIDIGIPPSSQSVELVSAPKLTLSYWGVATQSTAPMFAQLVDRTTGTVLDNQATPFLLTLDGTVHTLTVSMNTLAWQLDPSSQVELQLTDGSDLYYHQTAIGLVDVTSATARFNYSVQS